MKTRFCFLVFTALLLFSCNGSSSFVPSMSEIDKAVAKGEFSEASKLIKMYLLQDSLRFSERDSLEFLLDKMERIRLDFNKEDTTVINYVKRHYPGVTDKQINGWIESNALENMVIDGKRYFFARSARNLFRIDSLALANFDQKEAREPDSLQRLLTWLIPQLVDKSAKSSSGNIAPARMRIKYSISVKPDAVPEGEIVRAWLPYPERGKDYQTDINLLSSSQPDYLISPQGVKHSSIYMEKRAVKGEPIEFGYTLEYTSYARYPKFNPTDIKLYKPGSVIVTEYTAERAPHIQFSDRIKKAVEEAVGMESNPYMKVKKIYEWIDSHFPWAGAREYSTIDNIPEYVLTNRHGDCGQVSLLFITMARYAGIPAKWQSGWMMQPGNENLHDWAEVYFEGIGWIPVDQSFGRVKGARDNESAYYYFTRGLDPYRLVVNDDFSADFYPAKVHFRSETLDFQRGEVEWRGGNLYFNKWNYKMEIEYLNK